VIGLNFKVLHSVKFLCFQLKEFKVIGRAHPKPDVPNPPLYRMKIFAPDRVVAKSRYWYFASQLKKLKKSAGEIVSCEEVSLIMADLIRITLLCRTFISYTKNYEGCAVF
jgi:Ribosomal proteins 50S-L18Ae/60S-L20/60S-L18A